MSSKIYLASDLHLGPPDFSSSRERENKFIIWLDESVKNKATEIHLLGDMFDFWFEYKEVVPKGGVRLLAKIANIVDAGIHIHYHVGNHDLWTFGYLEEEIGVKIHRSPIVLEFDGLKCMIGHGDGIGPGDKSYKFFKSLYTSKICQFLFRWVHPDIGIGVAKLFSGNSREKGVINDGEFVSADKELIFKYCENTLKTDPTINCFIFGHRHLPLDLEVANPDSSLPASRYVNIGDWVSHFSSAKIIDGKLTLNS